MWNCKGCKNSCCRKNIVPLSKEDVLRIIKVIPNIMYFVDFVPTEYAPKGEVVKGNKYKGVLVLKHENGGCVFLKDNRCSIHEHRPRACRLYPFNPIFTEHKEGYSLKVNTREGCREIKKGHFFEYMPDALKWREERLEYKKIVEEWNKRKDRNLIKFIGGLIK